MLQEFDARKYASGSADGRPVKIGVDGGLLQIKDHGGPPEFVPLTDLEMRLGGQNGRRIILSSKSSGDTYLTEDLKFLDALSSSSTESQATLLQGQLTQARRQIKSAPWQEAKWWAVTVVLVAAIGASIFAGVDLAVGIAEKQIPPDSEEQLGKLSVDRDKPDKKLEQKSAAYQRVKTIGDKLLAHYKNNPYHFNFYVAPSDEINAYALPGGNIIVNSHLVQEAKSDDELAGVLAHEIGHVEKRHSLKAALRSAGIWVCISFITGHPSQDQLTLISTMVNLEDLQFSRKQETEADEVSVDLTSAAGYRPDGIVEFFQRIEKQDPLANGKALSMLSTHPMPAERIEHIKALIERRSRTGTATETSTAGGIE
ncbi:MAG: M48 family metallopeptidase [Candidatus Obscuribacterales bacterium]|jgi:Zn-dependent protease with chaperone function